MVSTVEKKLDLGTLCRLCGAHQLESGLGERPTNERPFESGPFEFVRARASEYVQFRVNRRSERTCPPTLSLSLSLSLAAPLRSFHSPLRNHRTSAISCVRAESLGTELLSGESSFGRRRFVENRGPVDDRRMLIYASAHSPSDSVSFSRIKNVARSMFSAGLVRVSLGQGPNETKQKRR